MSNQAKPEVQKTPLEKVHLQLHAKTDKIKGLVEDAEIPDDYKEDKIKSISIFNTMIDENKAIVDEGFKILEMYAKLDTDYTERTGPKEKDWLKKDEELEKEFKKIPEEMKSLFGIN